MIVTLSGVTGIGKSFYKNVILNELNFNNMVIVTTREKRNGEINGIDKIFVNDEEFKKLKTQGKIKADFEFLGYKYAYRIEDMQSNLNKVTEVHYSTISNFKKNAIDDVFSIYIIPDNYERAKEELKKRKLPKEVEIKRLKEIDEHINEYSNNEALRKEFNCVFINKYDEKSKNDLINIVKKCIKQKGLIKV